MADTTDTFIDQTGAPGQTFGSDNISGVDYPRVKMIIGVDGTNDGDVASSNPLPSVLNVAPAVVAAGSRGPYNENVTAAGDQELIAAPSTADASCLYVTGAFVSNNGGTVVKCSLTEGTGMAAIRWAGTLSASGGSYEANFHPPWKLAANTALVGNLGTASNVDWNIHFFKAL